MTTIHKFSEFQAPSAGIKHSDLVDKTFVIHDYQVYNGKFGEYAIAVCEIDGEMASVLIGSEVLLRQLRDLPAEAFPVEVTIVKTGRYYQFV